MGNHGGYGVSEVDKEYWDKRPKKITINGGRRTPVDGRAFNAVSFGVYCFCFGVGSSATRRNSARQDDYEYHDYDRGWEPPPRRHVREYIVLLRALLGR